MQSVESQLTAGGRGDQRQRGPEAEGTRGRGDQRQRGPEAEGTRGRGDQREREGGMLDHNLTFGRWCISDQLNL